MTSYDTSIMQGISVCIDYSIVQVEMPPMAPYIVPDWHSNDEPTVKFDCLLPTGIIVPLEFDRELTIAEIKEVTILHPFLLIHEIKKLNTTSYSVFLLNVFAHTYMFFFRVSLVAMETSTRISAVRRAW